MALLGDFHLLHIVFIWGLLEQHDAFSLQLQANLPNLMFQKACNKKQFLNEECERERKRGGC